MALAFMGNGALPGTAPAGNTKASATESMSSSREFEVKTTQAPPPPSPARDGKVAGARDASVWAAFVLFEG